MMKLARFELEQKLSALVNDRNLLSEVMKLLDSIGVEYGFPQTIDVKLYDSNDQSYTIAAGGKCAMPKLMAEFIQDLYAKNRWRLSSWLRERTAHGMD